MIERKRPIIMKIIKFKNLPMGDNVPQCRMWSDNGYVDFSILKDQICAHTWHCPGEGRIFLMKLEKYADYLKLKLTISTVLNPKLRKILEENGYSIRYVPYMDDVCELWEK